MKIVVLAGGLSPERDVSLSSGSLIANALIKNGHQAALVDIYTPLPRLEYYGDYFYSRCEGKTFSHIIPNTAPDLTALRLNSSNGRSLIGSHVLDICRFADLVFIALHGGIGENGQLQAVLDSFGIPYTGTGYEGSLLAMDKVLSKEIMTAHGILTPAWEASHADSLDSFVEKAYTVGLPCVAKPASCGSSIGISIINQPSQLEKAWQDARTYDSSLLLEAFIKGREFSVGILNQEALPPIEILPDSGVYDYQTKYQAGLAKELCPAPITGSLEAELKTTALKVHNALRLGYYSRIDFLADEKGQLYCLEANTLPGMTPNSLLPQEARAAGISYEELCEKIIGSVNNL